MQRPVASLPLSSRQKTKLKEAGFETTEDMKEISVAELSREIGISTSDALEILNSVNVDVQHAFPSRPSATCNASTQLHPMSRGQSALQLLKAEQDQQFIVTFSSKVDEMLGGGVAMGKITEFCGAPGIGKTQLSMQLAVDVSIPEPFGGVDGEAIYIDTEGSFIVERVAEIAMAAIQHIASVAEKNEEDFDLKRCAEEFTLDKVLGGIHYFRCHDYVELVALVNILPQFIAQHPKVRLVVVDSIAAPFRHGFADDMGMRNRILSGMAQNLIKLATVSNLAVVLTNQMTTKPHPHTPKLVPALGESWGHVSTIRVVLYWNQSQRLAVLFKSPTKPETVVLYQVTQDGVRDTVDESELLSSQDAENTQEWLFQLSSSQLDDFENLPDECGPIGVKQGSYVEVKSRKRSHPES